MTRTRLSISVAALGLALVLGAGWLPRVSPDSSLTASLSSDAPLDVLFVAAPEDLIVQKLRWYRDGGEVSERQWRDVLGLIKVQGTRLDHDLLAQGADRLTVADLLRRAVQDSALKE